MKLDLSQPVTLIVGDCREKMRQLPENSIDAIVCDPPYDLTAKKKGGSGMKSMNLDSPYGRARIGTGNGGGFMGLGWDATGVAFNPATWVEALRVLKPGGHLLAFGGTRTYHRMACAVEDAGFEIRDCVQWLYGSGFPKSMSVGACSCNAEGDNHAADCHSIAHAKWNGWGTALKPANEPIVVARKPLIGTVAANVEQYGTGALNIDACRIATTDSLTTHSRGKGYEEPAFHRMNANPTRKQPGQHLGRWPANVLLDEDAARELDAQSGTLKSGAYSGHRNSTKTKNVFGEFRGTLRDESPCEGSKGGASRFFYCAKVSSKERGDFNNHPTVKPVALMRWLLQLVTPPSGVILDPFLGSGSTGVAAVRLDLRFVGIEQDRDYMQIAVKRIERALEERSAA